MNAPFKPIDDAALSFVRRHIGPSPRDVAAMLETVGAKSLSELVSQTMPAAIRQAAPLDLGTGLSETEALGHMRELAAQNRVFTSLIGQGYSGTIMPAVIQRNILENPAWYTAYTPYQPEISQGRLEALFNFQTMICDLAGLDVANASLLDEGTAAAEAMALAERSAKAKTKAFFVDRNVHPQTLAVLRTRAKPLGWSLIVGDPAVDLDSADVFGGILQYPDTTGALRDPRAAIAKLHDKGALAILAADLLALTLIASPGELGADIAIGSAQRYGVPMGYGGPHAAYMAVRDALKRSLPGRIVGLSVDSRGAPAYRLALQTREQHIRREKATSNICTAQVLLAVIAAMYAVYHGPEGLSAIARTTHRRAAVLAAGLRKLGFTLASETFFDTVSVDAGNKREDIVARALKEKINLGRGDRALRIAVDETTTPEIVEAVWRAFGGSLSYASIDAETREALPPELKRQSRFLT
ncbi:MAG: aminomethyl-transferring glycine dehydrogenase subunit GcvPA, partial [Bradyrhizobium sp.]|uniref:aminomethyl-transferring glycine dehydrogenase subunit GcvPA n=1 Tax=Bradyrhizobium sp. TaxID=376 RepID=UPI003C79BD71